MSGYVGINSTVYTPVEYIESSGTQYIDTGFKPNQETKIELDVQSTSSTTSNVFAGGRQAFQNNAYYISQQYGDGSNAGYRFAYGTEIYDVPNTYQDVNRRVFVLDKNLAYFDNTLVKTFNVQTFTSPVPMWLFAGNNNGSIQQAAIIKMYSCKIYDNGTLVRDFIPVLDSNNVACLYDLVESKYYYNKGSGTFSYGTAGTPVTQDVARRIKKGYIGIRSTYTPVEYIGSSGTQYIDTEFKHNQNTRIVAKFEVDDYRAWAFLFGSCGGANAYPRKLLGVDISDTGKFGAYYGLWYETYNMNALGIHEFDFNKNILTIDDETRTATSQTFQSQFNDLIFGATNYNGGISISADTLKLYYFKIYDNDVLVRDYIPVIDNNNVACLWEKVEEKAYYNAGTGTFTVGNATGEPDIEVLKSREIKKGYVGVRATYTPIEYIGSSKTQYIDTGVLATNNVKVEMEISNFPPSGNAYQGIFGGRTAWDSSDRLHMQLGSNNRYLFDFGSNTYTFPSGTDITNQTLVIQNKNVASIGNQTMTATNVTFSCPRTIWLFAINDNGTPNDLAAYRLHWCKVYSDGVTLTRDFVPVLDDKGVACLWEKVEQKAYYNKGTGIFTAGNVTGEPDIVDTSKARQVFPNQQLITPLTINDWFTVSNNSYYFTGDSSGLYRSNNNGVNSSTAQTILTARYNLNVSFNYRVSSESGYDKLTITVGSTTIANGISGTVSGSWSGTLVVGQAITFKYTKDSSSSSGDDRGYFWDMIVVG